jgi:hypothetical protein
MLSSSKRNYLISSYLLAIKFIQKEADILHIPFFLEKILKIVFALIYFYFS